MKIHWGTGLLISMILFIGFILYFVIKVSTDKKYSHDLVSQEYYKKEQTLQIRINAQQNSAAMKDPITEKKTDKGYLFCFPNNFNYKKITGKVILYRPSNKNLDFEFPIKISSSKLLIPNKYLLPGRWNISIRWKYENKDFLFKTSIIY